MVAEGKWEKCLSLAEGWCSSALKSMSKDRSCVSIVARDVARRSVFVK